MKRPCDPESKGRHAHRGKPCSVEGCVEPNYGRGFCRKHYLALPDVSARRRGRIRAYEMRERARPRQEREPALAKKREKMKERYQGSETVRLKMRETRLSLTYGITLDEVEQMRTAQGGCCALCGRDLTARKGKVVVDHCHRTGKVRGLLHMQCNMGLGQFDESPELLERAAAYLRGKLA